MGAGATLQVEQLGVRFGRGRAPALDDVSLTSRAGEILLLTGPSGSGKSTLLRCANGLIPGVWPAQMEGRVLLDGEAIAGRSVAELARKAGFVFQSPESQLFNLTVAEEVRFGPRQAGLVPARVEDQARWALTAVGIEHLESRRLDTLSGGEKQRVALASVMALRPSLLLLDEPTAHLDVLGARLVLAALEHLCRQEGVAAVVGEHRTGAVGRLADRLLVLEGGRLVADGPTAEVFARRDLMRRLGVRRPVDEPERPWEGLIGASDSPAGQPLAVMAGVDAGYGKQTVLRGFDLVLHAGQVVALVGNNGAGKTTVARLFAGLHRPAKGTVRVAGRPPRPGLGVGMVMEEPARQLFCDTVAEEVAFGPRNFDRYDAEAVEAVLGACDLAALRRRRVHTLSCGQQQRTAVAASLATRPALLILDEPTRGQDWAHLASIMAYLRQDWLSQGACVLLVTHDYKLVHRYADRVVLLRDGRVAADGSLRQQHDGTFSAGEAE